MDFNSIHKLRFKLDLNRQEIIILSTIFISLGVLSTFKPFYTLVIFLGLMLITVGALNPTRAFLGFGIFLIFQAAIFLNMMNLGAPEKIVNLVKRSDEFIWILFVIYLLLSNYKGQTWRLHRTQLDIPIIIFIGIGLLSAFINHNSTLWSLIAIFLSLKGFIMYLIAINLKIDEEETINFFKILIGVLFFALIIGILQFIGIEILQSGVSKRLGVRVAQSIFAHHGVFGSLMAIGVALTIGITLATEDFKWAILSMFFSLGLIISSVRRSFVGILIGLSLVLLYHKRLKIKRKTIYLFGFVLIILLVIFSRRISIMTEATKYGYGFNIQPRYWLYYGTYKILKNKPFFGEGPGRYGSYVSVLTKSGEYTKYGIIIEDRFKMDAYWASILGEYGIIGLLVLVSMLLLLYKNLIQSFKENSNNTFIEGLKIGYLILFGDYIIEAFVAPVFIGSLSAFIFFVGLGLIIFTKKGLCD